MRNRLFPALTIGTLLAAGTARAQNYYAYLNGANETPTPVVTSATGVASAVLNADMTLSYYLTTQGLTGTAAHIHTGPPGVSGGIMTGLNGAPAGAPTTWCGTTPVLTAPQLNALNTAGGGLYMNVHTGANPGGEIRGPILLAGPLPTMSPGGCSPIGVAAPQIRWVGGPASVTASGPFAVRVSNALSGVTAILVIGLNNGPPFPLDLQTLVGGTGPCTLLNDFLVTTALSVAGPGACDGNGSLLVPNLATATVGSTLYLQWVVVEPGGPLSVPIVLSNGLNLTFQP